MEQDRTIESDNLTLKQRVKQHARKLKREITAVYLALKCPETPLCAKISAAVVIGYALSPVDLIPDFIPFLGYLDDAILLPLCIALVIRMIPADILEICRREAEINPPVIKQKFWAAAYVIIFLWLTVLYLLYKMIR